MFTLFLATAMLQQQPAVPPETKQFAFWLGEWTCDGTMYGAKNTQTKATNHITMDLGGHVVHEHFRMAGFNGESWSVYVPAVKKWRQTWVDDSGAYLTLEGGWADGKMTLTTLTNAAKPKTFSRMVFSNITEKGFDWNWESTADAGVSWKTAWHLHYTKKK